MGRNRAKDACTPQDSSQPLASHTENLTVPFSPALGGKFDYASVDTPHFRGACR